MIPQSLVFMFTYHCNFNCDHCSVDAGPSRREVVSISVVKNAIDQAYNISTVKLIVFTGGEPTMFLNNLKEGITYAQTKGFLTRLVTNSWWAKTPEKAMGFLRELVSCGLKELNISYDDFHASYLEKFGGEQNVLNAVRAAQDLGLTVLIGSAIHPEARVRTGYLRQLFTELGISKVQFLEDFVFPLGRARRKLSKDMLVSDVESIKRACKEAGKTLVVLPNGDVTFCCGHILCSEAQHLITLGNVASGETLTELVDRMQRNVLYWWLHQEGPGSVLDELGVDKKLYRSCEACYFLGTLYKSQLIDLATKKEEIFKKWERGIQGGVSA